MSRVKEGSYVLIQDFMVRDMGLSGNKLIIYAIIYGFSQDGEQRFTGSLQYLADWCCSTKQSVIKNLKSLCLDGHLTKNVFLRNGVKFVEYVAETRVTTSKQSLIGGSTKFNEVLNKVEQGSKQSLPNSIDNNKVDNTDDIKDIVDYLNLVCKTAYKKTTKSTTEAITARLKDGYTVEDFKTVISKKYEEWRDSDMERFLRPITLFGTKFENYLNAPYVANKGGQQSSGGRKPKMQDTNQMFAELYAKAANEEVSTLADLFG